MISFLSHKIYIYIYYFWYLTNTAFKIILAQFQTFKIIADFFITPIDLFSKLKLHLWNCDYYCKKYKKDNFLLIFQLLIFLNYIFEILTTEFK